MKTSSNLRAVSPLLAAILAALATPVYADYILRVPNSVVPAPVPVLSVFDTGGSPLTAADYGEVAVGSVAEATYVGYVKNTGTAAATLTGVVLGGDAAFQVDAAGSPNCASLGSLLPDESCGVYVSFSPTMAGIAQGTYTLGGSGGLSATVPLTGTGTAPQAGQAAFTATGTYSWTVPAGVYSVSVVAVGAGGGGGGNGGGSSFGSWVSAGGGKKGGTSAIGAGGTVIAGTGYAGGAGEGGGGGAGGYAGAGGKGGTSTNGYWGGAGGGVGLYGQGSNGSGGYSSGWPGLAGAGGAGGGGGGGHGTAGHGKGGQGGSAGNQGGNVSGTYPSYTGAAGGLYGGGGGGGSDGSSSYKGHGGGALAYKNSIAVTPGQTVTVVVGAGGASGGSYGGAGGNGAVRVIWPGDSRAFPSTGVADQP